MWTSVSFHPGRTDATDEMTDIESFAVLEPKTDGFRNYVAEHIDRPAEEILLDKADLLTLTAKEMTVLVGGLRVLGATAEEIANLVLVSSQIGVKPYQMISLQPYFDKILSGTNQQSAAAFFAGKNTTTGTIEWHATRVDLIFGSNAQLRAISELYASADGQQQFITDFIDAWVKVMDLDRFDL